MNVMKIDGKRNSADILTKHLAGARFSELLVFVPIKFLKGRRSLAPQLQEGVHRRPHAVSEGGVWVYRPIPSCDPTLPVVLVV